jgi:hypothetical protein
MARPDFKNIRGYNASDQIPDEELDRLLPGILQRSG